jgi:hypothetical protein
MPLYMDHHMNLEGLTAEAVAEDHKKDLEVQEKHGAKALKYWFSEEKGEVYCLFEGAQRRGGRSRPPRGARERRRRDNRGQGRLVALHGGPELLRASALLLALIHERRGSGILRTSQPQAMPKQRQESLIWGMRRPLPACNPSRRRLSVERG